MTLPVPAFNPPMAAAPPGPAIPEPVEAVAAAPPRTYRELYGDAANNPAPERTAAYLAGYCFTDVGGAGVRAACSDDRARRQATHCVLGLNGRSGRCRHHDCASHVEVYGCSRGRSHGAARY
jgi:hypothetical protein